jgi:hydrogenase-4 component F
VILTALAAAPFLLGALAWAFPRRVARRTVFLGGSFLQAALVARVAISRPAPEWGGALALDGLGLLFLSVLTPLFSLAAVYTFGYMALHRHPKHRHYIPALLFFLGSMTLASLSRHMGLFWVALEATTLSSASLIFFDRSPRSLEAAWKYLILCSVGIALALAGTFFLALALPPDAEGSLLLDHLLASAPAMSAPWLKTAFLFLLVGYGTKMGLAPMHTWLPDAHAEAPSPVSALLSGALLNCAFLGILRAYQVVAHAGLADFANGPLLVLGFLSMGTAAAFLIRQPDYKRLLAYSSVEHMGILAVGLGLGCGRAAFGALLHAVNHSAAKALLFFAAGSVYLLFRTKNTADVAGLGRRSPTTAVLFFAGFLAITGTPPFGLFVSEVTILFGAIEGGHPFAAALYLLLLAVAFVAMAAIFVEMAFGEPPRETSANPLPIRQAALLHAPAALLAAACLTLGVYLPEGLVATLREAVASLGVRG